MHHHSNNAHLILLIFSLITLSFTLNLATSQPLYSDHCNSMAPESLPTNLILESAPSFVSSTGYLSGGVKLIGQNSEPSHFHFEPHSISNTQNAGTLKLNARLILHGGRSHSRSASFDLSGFWCEQTAKLCMVGSGAGHNEKGQPLTLSAVFKLNLPKISNISNSMVAGTIESLDSLSSTNHFDPLFFLTNTRMAYEYTLVRQVKNLCDKMGAEEEGSSLVFKFEYYFCQDNGHKLFKLEYGNSAPFAGASTMILSGVHCSDDGKFRVNIGFFNGTDVGFVESFVPNRTLVGEGFWDRGRDRLCFIGCSAITLGESTGEASVGDCSIGFSLWFPAVLSLRSRSSPVGKIWSNRDKTDPAYFDTVKFRSINKDEIFTCSEYNYTVTDAAIEMRLRRTNDPHSKKKKKKKKKLVFPDAETFHRLMFDMALRNSQGRTVSGYAVTLFPGKQLYCDSFVVEPRFFRIPTVTETNRRVINVSYSIRYELFLGSSGIISSEEARTSKEVYYMKEEEISAEGIYDSETGMLYMVGCRHVGSVSIFDEPGDQGDDSLDCNLRVEIQIPPEDSELGERFNGTIWSTREEHDPLYFAPVEVSSHGGLYSRAEVEVSSHGGLYSRAEPESFVIVDDVQTSEWVDADKLIFSAYFLVVYIFIGLLFIHLKRPDMGSRSS